jgi:MFS family permease
VRSAGARAALALIAVDVAAVPAVLPSVRVELGSSSSGLVWVQAAYLLGLAVVSLLAAGRVDREASAVRVAAVAGVAAFAGGAVLASTADSTATLVTGRALQGAGAGAMLMPALAGPVSRVAAGALVTLGVAPVLGGAIVEESSWRWLFRIEVLAAVPALLLAAGGGERAAAPDSAGRAGDRPATPRSPRIGASLPLGLVLAVVGLVQSGPWGWASADTLLLLVAGAVLLFVGLRDRWGGWEVAFLTLSGCLAVALLLAPQYLELDRGLSPLRSGVLTAVVTVSAATFALLSRLFRKRLPPRLPLVGGLACAALGALGMTRIDPASSYALVIVSSGLLGSGIGAAGGTLISRAGAPRLATAAAAGAALIVAAAGALLQRAQQEEREAGGSFEDALAAGLAASGWLLAALLAAAALLAWRESRGPRSSR